MSNYYNWRRNIPDEVFEECIWCDDNQELWEKEVDAELDRRFWANE